MALISLKGIKKGLCMDTVRRGFLLGAVGGAALASTRAQAQTVPNYLQCLTSDLTLFVRSGGSDRNDGLSEAAAFATIQHAYDVAAASIHLAGYKLIINVGDGTFAGLSSGKGISGCGSPDDVIISGNGYPTTITQSSAYGSIYLGNGMTGNAMLKVHNVRISNPIGFGLMAFGGGCGLHYANIYFDTCANNHVHIGHNAWGFQSGPCLIYGGAQSHIAAITNGIVANHNAYVGFNNDVTFSDGFVNANAAQAYPSPMTFGSPEKCHGRKFQIRNGGLVSIGGCVLPGDQTGVNSGGYLI